MSVDRIAVRGRLYLVPTEFAGRAGAIRTEYQGTIRFDKNITSVIVKIAGDVNFYPGDKQNVDLVILNPDLHPRILVGSQFTLLEGYKTVGVGVVSEVPTDDDVGP